MMGLASMIYPKPWVLGELPTDWKLSSASQLSSRTSSAGNCKLTAQPQLLEKFWR